MAAPRIAVFTKDDPCSKLELWLCFKRERVGFIAASVVNAHAIIGLHAPRYMEKRGYLIKVRSAAMDAYQLTPAGEAWLTKGILAYAKNHPAEAKDIRFLPGATLREEPPSRVRRLRRPE